MSHGTPARRLFGSQDDQDSSGFDSAEIAARIRSETENIHRWKIRSEAALAAKTSDVHQARESIQHQVELLKTVQTEKVGVLRELNTLEESLKHAQDEAKAKRGHMLALHSSLSDSHCVSLELIQRQQRARVWVSQAQVKQGQLKGEMAEARQSGKLVCQELKDDLLRKSEQVLNQDWALSQMRAELDKMTADIQSKNESVEGGKRGIAQLQDEQSQAQHSLVALDDQRDDLERDLDTFKSHLSKERAQSTHAIDDLDNVLSELTNAWDQGQSQIQALQTQVESRRTALASAEKGIETVKGQILSRVAAIKARENEDHEWHRVKVDESEAQRNQVEAAQGQWAKAMGDLQSREAQCEALQQELSGAKSVLEAKVVVFKEMQRERAHLLCSNEELKLVHLDLVPALAEVDKLLLIADESQALEVANEAIRHNLKHTLEPELEQKKAEVKRLKSRQSETLSLDRQIEEFRSSLESVDAALLEVRDCSMEEIESLKKSIVDQEDRWTANLREEETFHDGIIQDRDSKIESLTNSVEDLKLKIRENQNERDDLELQIQDLEAREKQAKLAVRAAQMKQREKSPQIHAQAKQGSTQEQSRVKRKRLLLSEDHLVDDLDDYDNLSKSETQVTQKRSQRPKSDTPRTYTRNSAVKATCGFTKRDRQDKYRFFKSKDEKRK